MPNDNAKARRVVAWAVGLIVAVGLGGWFTYRAVADYRREESRQRDDAENLRMFRYHDVLRDLDAIGDAGDEAARVRCRNAIELLSLMEPSWYRTYRAIRPPPNWLAGGSAPKP